MHKVKLSQVIKRIELLKEEIKIAKKDVCFDFKKFIDNEYSILRVNGNKIRRIKEFSNLDVTKLPIDIKQDEELMCFIWHFINIETQYQFLYGEQKVIKALQLKQEDYPYTEKSTDNEKIEDEIKMDNLLLVLKDNESQIEMPIKDINLLSSKDFTKRQLKVIKLYLSSMKKTEIAKQLKIDKSAVTKIIQRYQNRIKNKYT